MGRRSGVTCDVGGAMGGDNVRPESRMDFEGIGFVFDKGSRLWIINLDGIDALEGFHEFLVVLAETVHRRGKGGSKGLRR